MRSMQRVRSHSLAAIHSNIEDLIFITFQGLGMRRDLYHSFFFVLFPFIYFLLCSLW